MGVHRCGCMRAPLCADVVADRSTAVGGKLQHRQQSMQELHRVQDLLQRLQVGAGHRGGSTHVATRPHVHLGARVRACAHAYVCMCVCVCMIGCVYARVLKCMMLPLTPWLKLMGSGEANRARQLLLMLLLLRARARACVCARVCV